MPMREFAGTDFRYFLIAFYDGFVAYFKAKGARGVVATECETPALFAAVWAKRFIERFLDGEALGDAFLGLRRETVPMARTSRARSPRRKRSSSVTT